VAQGEGPEVKPQYCKKKKKKPNILNIKPADDFLQGMSAFYQLFQPDLRL
jgi:hypothetical protein